ncbi:MAG: DNA-3-methyladenine glycosylase 2 family protein [Planctomycetota bacterium]|nr:DNA-3-methyladenine glycosylase 2 family protein [Planctomycetota bacterium]MDA1141918.1 DNA-3-methyladenine glycosylase 2 family protein [Planctomycetota bacterium]
MSLAYDPNQAISELSKADKKLGKAIQKVGEFQLQPQRMTSPFEALARSIIYQQLSGKAAGTILGRVKELFPRNRIKPDLVLEMREEDLRGAGMSRNKVAAFRDLSEKTIDGTVPTLARLRKMEDNEIIERLVQVRGIGQWTVEMLLMFHLGRPDIMPATDLGIRKGYMVLEGMSELPKPSDLLSITEHWRPWRSVASWYLYRIADQDF